MPTISVRGQEMPASPIRKLAPLADAVKKKIFAENYLALLRDSQMGKIVL